MHLQGAALATLDQNLEIVHPRVVGSHMSATHQQKFVNRRWLHGGQTHQVGGDGVGQQLHFGRRGAQHLRDSGLERSQVHAVGVVTEHGQRQAVGYRAEPVAVGAGAQHHVQGPLHRGGAGDQRPKFGGVTPGQRGVGGHGAIQQGAQHQFVDHGRVGVGTLAGGDEGQTAEDLAFGGTGGSEQGGGEVGHVAHRQPGECQVVVATLQG